MSPGRSWSAVAEQNGGKVAEGRLGFAAKKHDMGEREHGPKRRGVRGADFPPQSKASRSVMECGGRAERRHRFGGDGEWLKVCR
jgi:hypothetical protein